MAAQRKRARRATALTAVVAATAVAAGCAGSAGSGATAYLHGAAGFYAAPGGVVWSLHSGGGTGIVLRSADGGARWQVALGPQGSSFGLVAAYFLGPDHAWAVEQRQHVYGRGETTTVLGTTDGGRHWWRSRPLPGDVATCCFAPADQVYFTDPRYGWLLATGPDFTPGRPATESLLLWRTADGGRTWTKLPSRALPLQGLDLAVTGTSSCLHEPSVAFASATEGWFAEGACRFGPATPRIWRTTDGGRTWTAVALPAPPGGWGAWDAVSGNGPLGGVDVGQPRVLSPGDHPLVLAPVANGPSSLVIERSADGGRTWTVAGTVNTNVLPQRTTPAGWFDPVSAADWIVGAPGRLIETADAGRTWRVLASAVSLPDSPASFTSLASGYLQGTGLTAALATRDAGRAWAAETVPPSAITDTSAIGPPVEAVQLASPGLGVAGGAAGIETSADGGRNWTSRLRVPAPIRQVDAVTSRVAFALADGLLLRSMDGGVTWSLLDQPGAGPVTAVDFWSASRGVAVLAQGGFVTTSDGGGHWRRLRLPAGWTAAPGGMAGQPGAASVCFTGAGSGPGGPAARGWLVASRGDRESLLASSDGGRTWRVALPARVFPPLTRTWPHGITIAGCRADAAWVLAVQATGPGGTMGPPLAYDLLRTADGGRSWLDVLRSPGSAPRPDVPVPPGGPATGLAQPGPLAVPGQFQVPAPGVAWYAIVPAQGGIAIGSTADGGLHWTATWFADAGALTGGSAQPAPAELACLTAADGRSAWALLTSGKDARTSYAYATSDGGRTWHRLAIFR